MKLGELHKGDTFRFQGERYIAHSPDDNNCVYCTNTRTKRRTKICIDVEVEAEGEE